VLTAIAVSTIDPQLPMFSAFWTLSVLVWFTIFFQLK